MRAHKSYCVKLLKPGAVFKKMPRMHSLSSIEEMLPTCTKGHTYSTASEMCRANWKKQDGFGVLAV